MKKIALISILMFFFAVFSNAAEKTSMAVYEFEVTGVDTTVGQSVAEFIQDGLSQSGRFKIIERSTMQRMLKEQQFQKTGCTSTECAVEVGKILNVNNIIVGRVSAIGNTITITIKLVDVELGNVILTDSVDTDTQDLLKEASIALATHFSKRVTVKGKVLKILGEKEIILNLGMQDGIDKNQELTIERLGETVKDDTGKIVYQKKAKIATCRAKEVLEEATNAEVISTIEPIKEGDVVEIKMEKLKPLAPILKGYQPTTGEGGIFTQKGPIEPEEGFFEMSSTFEGATDFMYSAKNLSGAYIVPKQKLGLVGSKTNLVIGGGGPLLTGSSKWLADMYGLVGYMFTSTRNTNDIEFADYTLVIMPVTLGARFYPFATLINPNYAEFKTAKEQRGAFSPYVSVNLNLYMGLYEPDTEATYSTASYDPLITFTYGFGVDLRAGIEVASVLFAEFIMRFASTMNADFDILDAPDGTKIGKQTFEFNLNSVGVGFGFRF